MYLTNSVLITFDFFHFILKDILPIFVTENDRMVFYLIVLFSTSIVTNRRIC